MTKFFSVVSFGFGLLGAVSAHALTCENMPSCAELGYSQNIPLACTKVVKCPFDITYKKCLNCGLSLTCADGGYEEAPLGSDYRCTVKPFEKLTCYTCIAKNRICSIGDVYYADGTCGKADDYDGSKTAIGVVYMLSDSKYGMPIEAESSEHGRVINLHDLTSNSSTYEFDPSNPYNNSYEYIYFGLYGITSGATRYSNSPNLLTAFKNNDPKLYTAGMTDTQTIANATSTDSRCTSGSYAPGTKNYNSYCNPTAAKAALAFYPPNVASNDAIAGAGNWYLPTIGELAWLYGINVSAMTAGNGKTGATGTNKTLVNNALTTLKAKGESTATTLTNSYHWSSSEYLTDNSWIFYMGDGSRDTITKGSTRNLRVSLAF